MAQALDTHTFKNENDHSHNTTKFSTESIQETFSSSSPFNNNFSHLYLNQRPAFLINVNNEKNFPSCLCSFHPLQQVSLGRGTEERNAQGIMRSKTKTNLGRKKSGLL